MKDPIFRHQGEAYIWSLHRAGHTGSRIAKMMLERAKQAPYLEPKSEQAVRAIIRRLVAEVGANQDLHTYSDK